MNGGLQNSGKIKEGAIFCACLVAAASILASSAYAAPKPRPIVGMPKGAHYCEIILTRGGSIKENYDHVTISSKIAGGKSGIANVTATKSSYSLHLDVPTAFSSAPSRGSDDTVFTGYYSGTGNTNFAEKTHKFSTRLKRGQSRISTHLVAKRSSGTFPQGTYAAELTLRCE